MINNSNLNDNKENIRMLQRVLISKGNEKWKKENESRKKNSKFDASYFRRVDNLSLKAAKFKASKYSRMFRNMQSAINKDVKATRRMIESGKYNSQEMANLEYRLKQLNSIRNRMKQSYKEDGLTVYNTTGIRKNALNDYQKIRGAKNAVKSVNRKFKIGLSDGEEEFKRRVEAKEGFFGDEDISFPAYEDLLEDFENAIKSYDSSQAREILRKVMGMKEDYYNTRIKGNSRAHK